MSAEQQLSPDRVKHLEFIQAVVARLGNNSFFVKGWTLTISAAFFAILTNRLSWKIAAVGFVPIALFWLLDAYYLRQERLFRTLYDDVRKPDVEVEPFAMNIRAYHELAPWPRVIFSLTLAAYYGPLSVVNLVFLVGGFIRAYCG